MNRGRPIGYKQSPETTEIVRRKLKVSWEGFTMIKIPSVDREAVMQFLAERKALREERLRM